MFAREAFDIGQCQRKSFQKSFVNVCRIGKVVVPLHPQTREGHPCFQGLYFTLALHRSFQGRFSL